MVIILLCLAAFLAGLVDAIVGGGGLIQTPAAMILLPQQPVANVMGTLKIPSFAGTSFAAWQYARKVSLSVGNLIGMAVLAFMAAFAGSSLLTMVSNQFMKPVLLLVLASVAIYTYRNKQLGHQTEAIPSPSKQHIGYQAAICLAIGFYDGFIGPGAGSLLIFAFVGILKKPFLQASAEAKFINLATNLGSIFLFFLKGKILFAYAIPMAICNALGGYLGAKMAILRGNQFIRKVFLGVVIATMIRFAWDVFHL
jgi:uncharacterized membrane protein YfcA